MEEAPAPIRRPADHINDPGQLVSYWYKRKLEYEAFVANANLVSEELNALATRLQEEFGIQITSTYIQPLAAPAQPQAPDEYSAVPFTPTPFRPIVTNNNPTAIATQVAQIRKDSQLDPVSNPMDFNSLIASQFQEAERWLK